MNRLLRIAMKLDTVSTHLSGLANSFKNLNLEEISTRRATSSEDVEGCKRELAALITTLGRILEEI